MQSAKFAGQRWPAGNNVVNNIMHQRGQGLARVNYVLILIEQLVKHGQETGTLPVDPACRRLLPAKLVLSS